MLDGIVFGPGEEYGQRRLTYVLAARKQKEKKRRVWGPSIPCKAIPLRTELSSTRLHNLPIAIEHKPNF